MQMPPKSTDTNLNPQTQEHFLLSFERPASSSEDNTLLTPHITISIITFRKSKGEYCDHMKYTGPEFRGLFLFKTIDMNTIFSHTGRYYYYYYYYLNNSWDDLVLPVKM